MLLRLKSSRSRADHHERRLGTSTLESFMSFGLGSGESGGTISQTPCGNLNSAGRGMAQKACSNLGVLGCPKCLLIKYCSNHCQKLHWHRHQVDCEHPVLGMNWQPGWVLESREPTFYGKSSRSAGQYLIRNTIPAADCLQLSYNEGDMTNRDFKLCFSASENIRNLVKTVNGLPKDYHGKCDILLNGTDVISVNRNLVTLFALLSAGPCIEESAELATHLMYSAALTATSAAYLRGCVHIIYGDGSSGSDMSFQRSLKTRGEGRIHTLQAVVAMKPPMEMFFSAYELPTALKNMKYAVFDPLHEDDRDRHYVRLKPAHRLALQHYWESGILAPFSLDTQHFTQPNRLMFSANGKWLGCVGSDPLQGWDINDVQESGAKQGTDVADIFGCLFFHVKRELMEFARRTKKFNISIHLTQFHSSILSKGISSGALPEFRGRRFDRIEMSNLVDDGGIEEELANWGPLLNSANEHACILVHSRNWHHDRPNATAYSNPRAPELLIERCNILALPSQLKNSFINGTKSPAVIRLIDSLDAFIDHEEAFQQYLREQKIEGVAAEFGLRLRHCNRVHPKRFGVPLSAPKQKLPDLPCDRFYNIFTVGRADLTARFIEFEVAL